MEKIVYFLGAGFSAPLGLPVMDNFLIKSKDMYFSNPEKYGYFQEVFRKINDISVVKNYYETNLFNIEEILSIFEMEEYLGKNESEKKEMFKKYLVSVINYYTPVFEKHAGPIIHEWKNCIFGSKNWPLYGYFFGNLFNLQYTFDRAASGQQFQDLQISRTSNSNAIYAVITLNYDMIFEKVIKFFQDNYTDTCGMKVETEFTEWNKDKIYVTKLHGSVDNGTIVPPTWRKGDAGEEVRQAWRTAQNLLREANQIRILGYSLPIADSYVRYLLKSSTLDAPHLKKIDVICLDQTSDEVKRRYDGFVKLNYYEFKALDIARYLSTLREQARVTSNTIAVVDGLEEVHNGMMRSY